MKISTSAPGRICLFGEHQDYLGLPVIAAAVDLRMSISGRPRDDNRMVISMPDINQTLEFALDETLPYRKNRDYFRSVINVLKRKDILPATGYDCTLTSKIPIRAGTSSSSAMVVAWTRFILESSGTNRIFHASEIGQLAHAAEVLEFDEPGGMMDQMTSAVGSIVFIDFKSEGAPEKLSVQPGTVVIGDSQQPKDTKAILSRVKGGTLNAFEILRQKSSDATIENITFEDVDIVSGDLTTGQVDLLKGNLVNRDILREALEHLKSGDLDHELLGNLLTQHHEQLHRRLGISTPKIENMIEASLKAGALGAKINGSGGGGCMFAYAPGKGEEVAEAIRSSGGIPYIVQVDGGVKLH